jgi:hypothetical protein
MPNFLGKNAELFKVNSLSEFLIEKNPESLRKYACMNWSGEHLNAWQNLDISIKTGNSSFEEIYGKPFFDFLNDTPEKLNAYHKAMYDTSVAQSVRRLRAILKTLDKKQTETLIKYALLYPARVRALVGAILQNIDYTSKALDNLKQSLNPLSTIKLGLKESDLPTKNNWYIK